MHLVTGHLDRPHITSDNEGAVNAHIFGNNNYIFEKLDNISAEVIDENTIRINPGEGIFNGRFFEINTAETVSVTSGSIGKKRNDLICIRYTKDAQTSVESMDLVVVEGTPTDDTPTDPQYNSQSILNGVGIADFPIYRAYKNGLSAPTLTPLFTIRKDIVTDVEIIVGDKADKTNLIDGSVTKIGTTDVGNTTTPIYIKNGVPTSLPYTIAKSVPSDAKFTDTMPSVTTSGSGNVVDDVYISGSTITVRKNETAVTYIVDNNVTGNISFIKSITKNGSTINTNRVDMSTMFKIASGTAADDIEIDGNSYDSGLGDINIPDGYYPIGIASFHIGNATTNGKNSSHCSLTTLTPSMLAPTGMMQYHINNHGSTSARVRLDVSLLCVKR